MWTVTPDQRAWGIDMLTMSEQYVNAEIAYRRERAFANGKAKNLRHRRRPSESPGRDLADAGLGEARRTAVAR